MSAKKAIPTVSKKAGSKAVAAQSFAKQFTELEEIVASFDEEEVSLDEGLKRFERGLQLAEELKKTLETVENTIDSLKERYRTED
ncbi:MAG: exodeoxyribonuclease VII small subunit [Candidatus Kerfeldbacteria bacterium CG15_BIG_FIL_POST_REV_8_21_14_020_45_12]|uniref:Exodeoxyribonuclease 7 small subunit n=1 Tax=Candidatus Kerfeldbacteria bacterium CG15_BIG_FIL_POST_REV_8_21_14_020_45_12 TaxID=2014247 RepID=A0A2M7H391_9BACT|nr:MAG: exodeoxyribonuclease VII small subunit [Candidatus Kerfeldbacteria bacterium CG15_BIG_FIL_POST_REV_8_21_14_020_45_12]PJA93851.1 MAG: exodeoxyribonuclease VII small subunit [Candidatus Kerfeldbacteria bacterium CG_4_9_14_3_um_filter_45_8]